MNDRDGVEKISPPDFSKIEVFKMADQPVAAGCSMGPGQTFPKDWEYCIGGTVFKCDGNGNWVNQHRSC